MRRCPSHKCKVVPSHNIPRTHLGRPNAKGVGSADNVRGCSLADETRGELGLGRDQRAAVQGTISMGYQSLHSTSVCTRAGGNRAESNLPLARLVRALVAQRLDVALLACIEATREPSLFPPIPGARNRSPKLLTLAPTYPTPGCSKAGLPQGTRPDFCIDCRCCTPSSTLPARLWLSVRIRYIQGKRQKVRRPPTSPTLCAS